MKNNRKNRIIQLIMSVIPILSTVFIAISTYLAVSKIKDAKIKEKFFLIFGFICMISGIACTALNKYIIYNQEILLRVALTGCLLIVFNFIFVAIQKACEKADENKE